MGSKNITITEEAYERLRAHKQPDESFTDVVLRLADDRGSRWEGYGALRDAGEFRETVECGREELDRDAERRQRRLFGVEDGE